MVPTGKESFQKSFVVYMRQTQHTLLVIPEDYPELRPILPQSSRLEYLLQIVSQNSIFVQALVKTPVRRYALDCWRILDSRV